MKFIKYCDPIFQYISLLEENSVDGDITYRKARYDIEKLLGNLKREVSNATHDMWVVYEEVYLPLLSFIDYKITNSSLPFAQEWDKSRLAYVESCFTGDKKFFQVLDEALKEKSSEKEEVFNFFYVCIKLGFLGVYGNNNEIIDNYLWEISKRLDSKVKLDDSKFSESTYEKITIDGTFTRKNWYYKKSYYFVASLVVIYLILCFALYNSAIGSFSKTLDRACSYTGIRRPALENVSTASGSEDYSSGNASLQTAPPRRSLFSIFKKRQD